MKPISQYEWRFVTDAQWSPTHMPLFDEKGNVLDIFRGEYTNPHYCQTCHASVGGKLYVIHGPKPHTSKTDKRYCIEHCPVPIEVRERPDEEKA